MAEENFRTERLSELTDNQEAIIVKVLGHGAFRKRITEMGFVAGTEIKVIKQAPLNGPIEYELLGYHVSLRHREAELIEIVTDTNANINNGGNITESETL